MMNVLIVGPKGEDHKTNFINNVLIDLGHNTAVYDQRQIIKENGREFMQSHFVENYGMLKPDFTLILKGMEFEADTIKKAKEKHGAPIVCWMFDVTLGGTYVEDCEDYVQLLKQFDTFFTIDASVIPILGKRGVNAKFMPQATYNEVYGEPILNKKEAEKFGGDVVFIGSVGSVHPNREKVLDAIYQAGLPLKIYGDVLYPKNTEPEFVKQCHTGYAVRNELHSVVCNASKIVVGCDGWPHRSMSHSVRHYHVLNANAFYLNTKTCDVERMFTPGVHFAQYKDENDLVKVIHHYLKNDAERAQIACDGQTEVLERHQLKHRLPLILEQTEYFEAN